MLLIVLLVGCAVALSDPWFRRPRRNVSRCLLSRSHLTTQRTYPHGIHSRSLSVSVSLCVSLSLLSLSLSVSLFSLLCIYPSINTLTHPFIHPPTHIMYIHPSNHGALTLTSINRSAMAHTHTHLYINPFAFLTAIQRPLASLPQASSRNQGTIKLSWKHNNVVLRDKQTHRAKTPAIRSAVSRFLRIIQFSILCMAQPSRNTE